MKKSLIAVAILSAFTASTAMADVAVGSFTIYGTAQSAVESISVSRSDSAAITDTSKTSQNRLMDQTSKVGFKISHDLGSGSTGLAQVESRVYLGNGGNNNDDKTEFGTRNTFVGLSNKDVGTVRLGRYDNAYKGSLKAISPFIYNNINDASAEYGSGQILNRLGARQGDMVAYESPKISGVTALVSYNFGKDSTNSITGNATADNTAKNTAAKTLMPQTALSLAYANGPFTVGYGYTTIANAAWQLDGSSAAKAAFNTTTGAAHTLTAQQFGGQYTFGEYSIGAVWETTASSLAGVSTAKNFDLTQSVYGITGAYKSGAYEIHLRMAQASDVSGTTLAGATTAGSTGATQSSVMVAYDLSKALKVIGSLTNVANNKNSSFTSASGFSLDNGTNMNQFAVGLAASF